MTLDWLAKIIGEAYTEEMDAQAAQEIGKRTVSREDFNKTKRDADTYKKQVGERDVTIADLQNASGNAADLQQKLDKQKADYDQQINRIKVEYAAREALQKAGAKNVKAALALIQDKLNEATLGEGDTVEGLEDWIKELTEGADSAFLFEAKESGPAKLNGAQPADPGNKKGVGTGSESYEADLAEARKNGDMAAVSAIKRKAAAEGIILM